MKNDIDGQTFSYQWILILVYLFHFDLPTPQAILQYYSHYHI